MNDHKITGADRKLITEDGEEYYGYGFGDASDRVLEIVFNTSMTGYQEILSDPSYMYQAVVMTYPLIGNYGMAEDDYESKIPRIGAMIVREYNDRPSNFRCSTTLGAVMKRYGIPGIWGVDTRKLTRSIRDIGSRRGLVTNADTPLEEGLRIIKDTPPPKDAVAKVSRDKMEVYSPEDARYHVAAIDCGMKMNIVRKLTDRGCKVSVLPWDTRYKDIKALQPDGLFISNGPGDPSDVPEVSETVKHFLGDIPVFGICLGHQILSLAYGARTYKLKFGHRGGNHPVRNLQNNKIEITSQNHSYAVDAASLPDTPLEASHINLLDDTIEGVSCMRDGAFSVQYHPESAPGPQDSAYLFDRFIESMKGE